MRIIKFFLLLIVFPSGAIYFALTFKDMSDEGKLKQLEKNKPSKVIAIDQINDHDIQFNDSIYLYDDEGNTTKYNTQKYTINNDNLENSNRYGEIEDPIKELDDSDFETSTPEAVKTVNQRTIKKPEKTITKKVKPVKKSNVVKLPVKSNASITTKKTVTQATPKFRKQKSSLSRTSPKIIQNNNEIENDSDYDEDDDIFPTQTSLKDTEIIESKKETEKKEFSSDPCKGRSARYIARCRHK